MVTFSIIAFPRCNNDELTTFFIRPSVRSPLSSNARTFDGQETLGYRPYVSYNVLLDFISIFYQSPRKFIVTVKPKKE